MQIYNKKGEIGTIILLLLLIGAIYVINHPSQDNIITIENGVSIPTYLQTTNIGIVFINKDNINYLITINGQNISIQASSRQHFTVTKGITYQYQSPTHSAINGRIVIS